MWPKWPEFRYVGEGDARRVTGKGGRRGNDRAVETAPEGGGAATTSAYADGSRGVRRESGGGDGLRRTGGGMAEVFRARRDVEGAAVGVRCEWCECGEYRVREGAGEDVEGSGRRVGGSSVAHRRQDGEGWR